MVNPLQPEDIELKEWLDSIDYVIQKDGMARAKTLLEGVIRHSHHKGLTLSSFNTPYINTIPRENEPSYPGDWNLEWKIRSIIRWNAMAMVVRANRESEGIGGHISTYASSATLYEVGFNHFFRGGKPGEADLVYFQGHASPGIYARAYLEGRLGETQLINFRRELAKGGGLSSYPHPRSMPEFWQFPTVSMGLGPITAIYQARFLKYLENRGMLNGRSPTVWAFLGDGETDEPESLGALTLASREKLDNLIFVVNCNLQRLDGPVRGNGKIIQELETAFRGAGWNAIKVIWGNDWDPLLARDSQGILVKRMAEVLDGDYQRFSVESGAYIREHFFGTSPDLLKLVEDQTDDQLKSLRRGGHSFEKVNAAYKAAVEYTGGPTVILAKTIKGYGLGEAGEGRNVTHQQKKMNEEELRKFRDRFQIPISDKGIADVPFYRPDKKTPEMQYLLERRNALGGFLPKRVVVQNPIKLASESSAFSEFMEGTGERAVSTTMVFVKILSNLLRDENIGKYIVPIVADEARTFGMESLFKGFGIYSSVGQLYEPVDKQNLLYYHESKDGQILEEGITEAGSLSSFIAGGTAYAHLGVPTIPFFIFYSMFGFQRVGDLIWAAGDARARGFLIGGTAGRTTLAGEGLQHQDGHSHLLAMSYPTVRAYDPAFAYEVAIIIKEGLRVMYEKETDVIYYLTVGNENYTMPAIPPSPRPSPTGGEGEIEKGIIKGLYRYKKSSSKSDKVIHLFGSGAILNEVLKASEILEKKEGYAAHVWSLTSVKALYDDALTNKTPHIVECLKNTKGDYVIATDYVVALPEVLSRFFPKTPIILGADGFGLSESREKLREHFSVDALSIVKAVLKIKK